VVCVEEHHTRLRRRGASEHSPTIDGNAAVLLIGRWGGALLEPLGGAAPANKAAALDPSGRSGRTRNP